MNWGSPELLIWHLIQRDKLALTSHRQCGSKASPASRAFLGIIYFLRYHLLAIHSKNIAVRKKNAPLKSLVSFRQANQLQGTNKLDISKFLLCSFNSYILINLSFLQGLVLFFVFFFSFWGGLVGLDAVQHLLTQLAPGWASTWSKFPLGSEGNNPMSSFPVFLIQGK